MIETTFPNPGVNSATFAMEGLAGRCSLTGEPFTCDIRAVYGPRARCLTMEWFAETVDAYLAAPTTVEELAARIALMMQTACAPHYTSVSVTHHPKEGTTLTVTAEAYR